MKSAALFRTNEDNAMSIFDKVIDEYKAVKAQKMLGIFGNPIKHTLSPMMHDAISDSLGYNERYVPFLIDDDLAACVKAAYDEGVLGLNITVPFKQEVMKSVVDIDPDAKAIGAVNTLVRADGGYKGYNTDMPGLYAAVLSEGFAIEGKTVVVLGAGGAARAAAYMAMKYGAAKLYILNRTAEKAIDLAADMNTIFDSKDERATGLGSDDLELITEDSYAIFQCTSLGLHEEDGLPVDDNEEFFKKAEYGVDLIYNPANTPFIKRLKELGVPCMNGLKMLLYQGMLSNQLWNGKKIETDLANEIYNKLSDAVYGPDNIVLIGCMGCGKTTVGKELSLRHGYIFVDTDDCIEEREGMSIGEIFEQKGEPYFRYIETALIREFSDTLRHAVISTGGGLPVREENTELLKKLGRVYYLSATPETLYDRIKEDDSRPLLNCEDPYRKLCELLLERHPRYEAASDETLNVARTLPRDIADLIAADMEDMRAGSLK